MGSLALATLCSTVLVLGYLTAELNAANVFKFPWLSQTHQNRPFVARYKSSSPNDLSELYQQSVEHEIRADLARLAPEETENQIPVFGYPKQIRKYWASLRMPAEFSSFAPQEEKSSLKRSKSKKNRISMMQEPFLEEQQFAELGPPAYAPDLPIFDSSVFAKLRKRLSAN